MMGIGSTACKDMYGENLPRWVKSESQPKFACCYSTSDEDIPRISFHLGVVTIGKDSNTGFAGSDQLWNLQFWPVIWVSFSLVLSYEMTQSVLL